VLTVNGNSNSFSQDVAIGTNEGGNLGQRIDFEISCIGDRSLSFDELQVQVIGLGCNQRWDSARVLLWEEEKKNSKLALTQKGQLRKGFIK
jgi:hypothetical protein